MLVATTKHERDRFDVGSVSLLAAYLLPLAVFLLLLAGFDNSTLSRLGAEDALFENIGVAAFFIASGLFLLAFARSDASENRLLGFRTRRNYYFLLLSALMFVCAAEEISWGQRIFGWQTPAWVAAVNVQGETNIHNMLPFSAKDFSGTRKPFLELLLNMNRLFAIFTLAYCILLPLTVRYWDRGARLVRWAGIPVPSPAIGGLFAAVYLSFHFVVLIYGIDRANPLDELKESVYGSIYLLIALNFARTQQPAHAGKD